MLRKKFEDELPRPRPKPPKPHPHPDQKVVPAISNNNIQARAIELQMARAHAQVNALTGRVRVAAVGVAAKEGKRVTKPQDNAQEKENVNLHSEQSMVHISAQQKPIGLLQTGTKPSQQYKFVPPAATKYYLWDNTPTGPVELLTPDRFRPHSIRIQPTALRALLTTMRRTRLDGSLPNICGFLIGRLLTVPGRTIAWSDTVLVLDRFDAGRVADSPIGLEPTFVTEGDAVVMVMTDTVSPSICGAPEEDGKQQTDWSKREYVSLCKLGDSAPGASSPIFPLGIQVKAHEPHAVVFTARMLIPTVTLRSVPITTIPMVTTTLTKELHRPSSSDQCFEIGFITIDQARHVLPLLASDPMAASLPLVGIWVKNVRDIKDPRVQTACMRWICEDKHFRKMDIGKQQMLVLVYNGGSVAPQFYECSYNITNTKFTLYGGSLDVNLEKADSGAVLLTEIDSTASNPFCEALEEVFGIHIPRNKESKPPSEASHDATSSHRDGELSSTDNAVLSNRAGTPVNEAPVVQDSNPVETAATVSPDTPPVETQAPSNPTAASQCLSTTQASDPTPTTQLQQQLYIAFLQQQLELLRNQLAIQATDNTALNRMQLPFLPMMPFFIPTGQVQHTSNPTRDMEQPKACDAATNTTLVEPLSQLPPKTKSFQNVKGTICVSESPTEHVSAPVQTYGTAELESALKRVNQTALEQTYHFPPDVGNNYKPFYSIADEPPEQVVEDESFQEPSDVLPKGEDTRQQGQSRDVVMKQRGEGRTHTLLQKVEELLEGSDDEDKAVAISKQKGECNAGTDGNAKEETNGNTDCPSEATDIIARLAGHPEKSFIFMDDRAKDEHNSDEDELVFKSFRPWTIRDSGPENEGNAAILTAVSMHTRSGPTSPTDEQKRKDPSLHHDPTILSHYSQQQSEYTACEHSLATLNYLRKYGLVDEEGEAREGRDSDQLTSRILDVTRIQRLPKLL